MYMCKVHEYVVKGPVKGIVCLSKLHLFIMSVSFCLIVYIFRSECF